MRVSFKSSRGIDKDLIDVPDLYLQQDFEKGFIYNDVREIVRIRDLIDVPHCSFLITLQ